MAISISSNIDIGRSLNSRDSFRRWKFKNRAPTSCSTGPILWPPTISFELHAEMAEEIDLEKCIFRNFGSLVTLTLDRVEVTLMRICGRGLPTHQVRWKSEKTFCGRTDGRTHLSSNLLGHRQCNDLKTNVTAKTREHNCTVEVKPHNSGLESPGIAISSSWIDESVLEPNPVILSDGITDSPDRLREKVDCFQCTASK